MGHVRCIFVTMTMLSLASAWLLADEKPVVNEPLSVLEDCIKAAEAGDFARYVDHLSIQEQELQAGYILYMTRSMAVSLDHGSPVTNPEMFLVARTMSDLAKKHIVPESDRQAKYQEAAKLRYQEAAKILSTISGEDPGLYSPAKKPVVSGRELCMKTTYVLKDSRRFLVEALGELARPTNITGEQGPKFDTYLNVGDVIKKAQETKWTLYTRGEYAVAMASPPPNAKKQHDPYSTFTVKPRTHLEFTRIDGHWKISRLLPASVIVPLNRMATVYANAVTAQ